MEVMLIIAAAFLAFSNGANDNFKGFATVWGSQTLSYRQALTLATVATVLGSFMALVLAESLVQQFSGKALVPDVVVGSPGFLLSVGLGAAATVMLATRIGLPVSTTHALIGGLVGAGLAQGSGLVNFASLSSTFLLPLLISPFVAASLGLLAYRLLRLRKSEKDCVCIATEAPLIEVSPAHTMAFRASGLRLIVDTNAHCDQLDAPGVRVPISKALDRVHSFSAASICFARGVNDTPKLTALLVAAQAFDARTSVAAIAILMALGGLLFARRVAQTMSQRIVRMDHAQGLAANLISSGLILLASNFGMPVSTTHVTVGSLAGVGVSARTIDWTATRNVLLSWVATLPLAAAAAYFAATLL